MNPAAATTLDQHPFTSWFGIDEARVRRVLAEATARGADFADLFFQHSLGAMVQLEDGIVSSASTWVDRGVGVRVVIGEQTGYAYSESLDLAPMLHAARTAAAIASGGEAVAPQAVRLRPVPDRYAIDRDWEDVEVAERLPLVREAERVVRELEPGAEKVSVYWSDSDSRVLVATSEGAAYADRRPMGVLRLSLTASRDGKRCTGMNTLARREGLSWFTPERVAETCRVAVERTRVQFDARRPPSGEMPVVLAAGASGILLHEAIGHGLEADFNRKGISIYADQIGQPVAPEFVTVVDDGTIEHERGALNVDDEGTPAERTVLIENGVLRSYMYDRLSAAQYGVPSTGSGRRQSFRHVPMPRMRCTLMEDGPHEYDELIASVDRGIVADHFWNGSVQIGAGDFTFYVKSGWLIEKGVVTAPIKDVNIIGNGPEALRNITMAAADSVLDTGGWTCGKDGQRVPVSQGIPSVLVKSLTVGGARGE